MPVIEVFADAWCPFAHAGLRALLARRRELGRDDLSLWIRAWPLELVNAEPLDAHHVAQEVAALRTQVAGDLFAGFDEHAFPGTSLPALALAASAYRRDTRTGEQLSFSLRDALFEQGRDISDPDILSAIADTYDLDPPSPSDHDAIRTDWHDGRVRGVKGSPHFFCGPISAFCPSLDISKDDRDDLRVYANPAALNNFMAQCLASPTLP